MKGFFKNDVIMYKKGLSMKKIFLLFVFCLFVINPVLAIENMTVDKAYKQIVRYSKSNNTEELNEFFKKYPRTSKAVYYNSEKLLKRCLKKEYSSEVFTILLKNGLSLSCLNPHPLITAIEHSDEELTKAILSSGIDVDMVCKGRKTPLFYATDVANPHIVQMLLNAGANPNAIDNAGNTPLLSLCRFSPHSKSIYYMLDAGADLFAYNKRDKMPYNVLPPNMKSKIEAYYDSAMTKVLVKKYVDENKTVLLSDLGTPTKKLRTDSKTEVWEYITVSEHYLQMIADTSATSSTSSITVFKGGYTEKVVKTTRFTLYNDCVSTVKFNSKYSTSR